MLKEEAEKKNQRDNENPDSVIDEGELEKDA
jgi:hypothetical protein